MIYRSNIEPGSQVQRSYIETLAGGKFTQKEANARNQSLTIKFVPDFDIKRIGDNAEVIFTAETIFVHEMKHWWNKRWGLLEQHQSWQNSTFLDYEEIDAVHFENVYRLMVGLEPRKIYSQNKKAGTARKLTDTDIILDVRGMYKLDKSAFSNNPDKNGLNEVKKGK